MARILVVLQMPDVHGFELITILRELSPPGLLGAIETIQKPVTPDRLLGAVEKALAAGRPSVPTGPDDAPADPPVDTGDGPPAEGTQAG